MLCVAQESLHAHEKSILPPGHHLYYLLTKYRFKSVHPSNHSSPGSHSTFIVFNICNWESLRPLNQFTTPSRALIGKIKEKKKNAHLVVRMPLWLLQFIRLSGKQELLCMQRVLFRCTVHECLSNKLTSVHFLKPQRKPCDLLDNIHLSILNVHVIDIEVLFTFTTRKHLALSRSSILHTLG